MGLKWENGSKLLVVCDSSDSLSMQLLEYLKCLRKLGHHLSPAVTCLIDLGTSGNVFLGQRQVRCFYIYYDRKKNPPSMIPFKYGWGIKWATAHLLSTQ